MFAPAKHGTQASHSRNRNPPALLPTLSMTNRLDNDLLIVPDLDLIEKTLHLAISCGGESNSAHDEITPGVDRSRFLLFLLRLVEGVIQSELVIRREAFNGGLRWKRNVDFIDGGPREREVHWISSLGRRKHRFFIHLKQMNGNDPALSCAGGQGSTHVELGKQLAFSFVPLRLVCQ